MTVTVPTPRIAWSLTALLTFVWAVLGAAIATVSWAVITGLPELTRGASPGWVPSAFIAGLFFGGFVALLLLVPYWGLLLLYAFLFARRPAIEQNVARFLVVAFCLASPMALVVFISFLDPSSPFWSVLGDGSAGRTSSVGERMDRHCCSAIAHPVLAAGHMVGCRLTSA